MSDPSFPSRLVVALLVACAGLLGAGEAESPLPTRALARLGTTRFRHAHVVPSVVYLPGGKVLATGSHLGTIRLWDPATGKELRVLTGHTGGVCALAASPDGSLLASSSWDRTIRLWDADTGALRRTLVGHTGEVSTLRFSKGGKLLASGAKDGTARLWNPATGKQVRSLAAHRGEVRCVAFAPDGKRLATAGSDRLVRLWEADTGKALLTCTGHTDRVMGVAFSPDGQTLASCSHDRTARLWDATTGKQAHLLQHHSWLEGLAFSPNGKSLAVACGWGNDLRLWDLTAKKPAPRWTGRQPLAISVAFSPDGKKLAGAGWESTVRLWDVATGMEEGAVSSPGHTGWVYATLALPGRTTVSAGSDARVIVWDAAGKARVLPGHTDRVNCLALSPDGRTLASGGRDRTVRLWDVGTWKERGRLEPGGSVKSVAFSPDGRHLATASGNDLFDGWVQEVPGHGAALWDLKTGKRLLHLEGHIGGVNAVAFAPDGRLLVTGGNDRTVRFWDRATGKELHRMAVEPGGVQCLAFSPDGATLATGGENGAVQLWDVDTARLLGTFTGASGWVVRLAFAPDGRTLLSASREAAEPLRLWDVGTGQERCRFAGHQGTAFGVGFSADGRTVVSGGGDGTVLRWDVTGRVRAGRFVTAELPLPALEAAWEGLAAEDGAKVHRAVWDLVAAPKQAVRLLRTALKPLVPAEGKVLDRLIRDLDDEDFDTRARAFEGLKKAGEPATAALRKARDNGPSAEVMVSARRLLDALEGPEGQVRALRQVRGVEVLEHIGNAEARGILQALARGAPGARLTREAKAALGRLEKRSRSVE